jgi:hypothetical protein
MPGRIEGASGPSAKLCVVGRRVLPVVLVALAGLADSQGAHGLALYALLLAVPLATVAALTSFGEYLDRRGEALAGLHALLWAVSVVLLVLSCAVRRHALHGVPPLAISTVVACLGIFAVKATMVAAPYLRRVDELRPAKP